MSILSGLTAIELCEVWQGPLAGQTLADYGARVIKIERPPAGDLLRGSDLAANSRKAMNAYFAASNSNKQSVCLDVKSGAGRRVLARLIESADILLTNYRPGVMDRLGFGYEEAAKLNPRLIYAVASGYGETGPLAQMAGQDLLIQAASGIATKQTGRADPGLLDVPLTDFASGMLLVQGILFALLERAKSGKGQKVSISLLDAAIAMQGLEVATLVNSKFETRWFETGLNYIAQTRDGWLVVLGFYRDNPLRLMCQALGLEDLSARGEFDTLDKQVARRSELADLLRPAIHELDSEGAAALLQRHGILAAPVLTLQQALASAQVLNNELFRTIAVPGQDEMRVIAHPVRFSRSRQELRKGPPRLGEDTAAVLAELGLGGDEDVPAVGAGA